MRPGILVTVAFAALSWAAPVTEEKRATPPLPSTDSFYSVPDNIASYAPGAIINHRAPPSPISAFGIDPVNIAASWQILYRTTDNLGNATATILTVLVPVNADFDKLLSYQVAEDAPNINCAPSYALQLESATGGTLGTALTQAELLLAEAALYQGWVVVLPDHEGPNGAYLANRLAGYATLDGIRAALQSTSLTGISIDAKVGLWGYSGGALASAWATVLQPEYAPELTGTLVGAAFGGTVPNIYNVITTINKTPSAGIIAAGMVGLAKQYPVMATGLEDHVLPEYQADFEAVLNQCFVPDLSLFNNADVINMIDNPNLWNDPVVLEIFANNSLEYAPAPPAGLPLFVYKAVKDEVSPIADTDDLITAYCAAGTTVEYIRDQSSTHGGLSLIGAPMALAWLIDRMNGKAASTVCSTATKYSMLLDIATLEVLPTFLLDALKALLGGEVGPTFFG
ncbi:hypothetical protein Sste5346_007923 [Sporothrix stenoceras]|uniref:Secretory lipase n=1 Tax=Sporothrix stenoceras TaxID=5173 RepID=A0ABR3YT70_9PEZI